MGQEIEHAKFSEQDFVTYRTLLKQETDLFMQNLSKGLFSNRHAVGGFEVEGWLVDSFMHPAPLNQQFFEALKNPLATPELAKFNIELNNTPLPLELKSLSRFEDELLAVFADADKAAESIAARVILTGILPTLFETDCCLENMSNMTRYHALNDLIFEARKQQPLILDIQGIERLKMEHYSVMLEAGATSFQVHFQIPWEQSHHFYNASMIASAFVLAASTNSPYLFGKRLWHESRIPLFEQSIDTGIGPKRVSFGSSYALSSIGECFQENVNDYPVLLPEVYPDKPESYTHLRLHNGVIWRWNRPLVGFDDDMTPHIRIEHRCLPAGPTIKDMVANAAFYYGLTQELVDRMGKAPQLVFSRAKNNFYQAAKDGLESTLRWDDQDRQAKSIILETLLPMAEQGLRALNIDESDIQTYLGVVQNRCESGQTGSIWQIEHIEKYGATMEQLTRDYMQRQQSGLPVHLWDH